MLIQESQLHNLPPQPTPFIGREPEIAEIVELLTDEDCRLLTLLGPGGIGKSRLSTESIRRLTENDFEHGVFYVPLAPLTSADNIVTTVIGVLGIMIGEDGTPQEELVKFLSGRNLLLVMDNFEHVLDGADLVADILSASSNVKILVTSREALNLQQEWVWHVRGMRFPDDTTIDDIDKYSALKLFLDRAKRVRREFSVDSELDDAIRICQLVGGMPLAIELSVSWLKTLSCQDIIKQIERGIDFLSTRARDIPERHRSIRAVFDYSWNLLSSDEQAVFPRLSIFRGGFTLEASENVARADLMTLSGLVEKSMVRRDNTGRFDIHELLRQYAEEKLDEVDETTDVLSAHATYFADFMREHAIDIKGRRQLEGLNEIEADFDNVVEVWNRAIDKEDYSALDDMVEGLVLYCDMRVRYQFAESLLHHVVNALAPEVGERAHPAWHRLRARWVQVWILTESHPVPSHIQEHLADCLEIAHKHNHREQIALCLWLRGEITRLNRDSVEAIKLYKDAHSLLSEVNMPYYVGRTLRGLDYCYQWSGGAYREQGLAVNQRHYDLAVEIGDRNETAQALHYSGVWLSFSGEDSEAQRYREEATSLWLEVGDLKSVAMGKAYTAISHFGKGEFPTAKELIIEAMNILSNCNFRMPGFHGFLGKIVCVEEDYSEGYRLCKQGEVTILDRDSGAKAFTHEGLALASCGLGNYSEAKSHTQIALSIRSQQLDIRGLVNCLPVLTIILAHEGQKIRAVELQGLAHTYSDNFIGWMKKWSLLTQLHQELESELGVETYKDAWERGTQLDFDSTVDELLLYLSADSTFKSSQPKVQPLAEPLTERELEVLALIADGLTNRQIAGKLYLSTGTVKVHSRNIYGKLNVSNRTEASTIARQLNLI
jgi:predicted ATPase/DNA-binding CsgD family transcriptional regulator